MFFIKEKFNLGKWLIFLAIIMVSLSSVSGCGKSPEKMEKDKSTSSQNAENLDNTDLNEQEDKEVENANRKKIAQALGLEENDRSLRFISASLETLDAGLIQEAKAGTVDGEEVLDIIAEDGTEYRMYLSAGGSVDAVENRTTGQWPIQSNR